MRRVTGTLWERGKGQRGLAGQTGPTSGGLCDLQRQRQSRCGRRKQIVEFRENERCARGTARGDISLQQFCIKENDSQGGVRGGIEEDIFLRFKGF